MARVFMIFDYNEHKNVNNSGFCVTQFVTSSLNAVFEAATRVKSTHLINLKTRKKRNMKITQIFT